MMRHIAGYCPARTADSQPNVTFTPLACRMLYQMALPNLIQPKGKPCPPAMGTAPVRLLLMKGTCHHMQFSSYWLLECHRSCCSRSKQPHATHHKPHVGQQMPLWPSPHHRAIPSTVPLQWILFQWAPQRAAQALKAAVGQLSERRRTF